MDIKNEQIDRDRRSVLLIYILYFIGFATGISAAAGVYIAYDKRASVEGLWQSHIEYQIRTFWIGLVVMVAGAVLAVVLVGYLIMLAWFVWTLVRCIVGVVAALEDRPIKDPQTLMW